VSRSVHFRTLRHLLEVFEEITLTVIELLPDNPACDAAESIELRIREISGFSAEVYTRLRLFLLNHLKMIEPCVYPLMEREEV
jgi:hypothetical protein